MRPRPLSPFAAWWSAWRGELPRGGDVLDVGNGLAEQDPIIAAVAAARSLTALNVTFSQLRAGRRRSG